MVQNIWRRDGLMLCRSDCRHDVSYLFACCRSWCYTTRGNHGNILCCRLVDLYSLRLDGFGGVGFLFRGGVTTLCLSLGVLGSLGFLTSLVLVGTTTSTTATSVAAASATSTTTPASAHGRSLVLIVVVVVAIEATVESGLVFFDHTLMLRHHHRRSTRVASASSPRGSPVRTTVVVITTSTAPPASSLTLFLTFLALRALGSLFFTLTTLVVSATSSSTGVPAASGIPAAEATTISSVLASLHIGSLRSSNIGGLVALVTLDDVELYRFPVAHATQVLARVVLGDGRLMDEDILLGVIPVYKAISALNVKPFHSSCHFSGQNFLLFYDRLLLNYCF